MSASSSVKKENKTHSGVHPSAHSAALYPGAPKQVFPANLDGGSSLGLTASHGHVRGVTTESDQSIELLKLTARNREQQEELSLLTDELTRQRAQYDDLLRAYKETVGSVSWKLGRLLIAPIQHIPFADTVWRRYVLSPLGRIPGKVAQTVHRLEQKYMLSTQAYQFREYQALREARYGRGLSGLQCGGEPNLVSIILPVYNGADLVAQAVESVLAQSYPRFELIVINDGSQDATQSILEAYAQHDFRIRVIQQENRKLPRSLSRGFRLSRGEYLTWISADNRLHPQFLAKMVRSLSAHPDWDMIYANQDIIGPDGRLLKDSCHYAGYQEPKGSGHVYLPEDPSELNTVANNYIGAAFLYRRRVACLLGDYSKNRFTTEDYDYWMLVNELLSLHHADFAEPVYEYRFHEDSLTARDEELGITRGRDRLMVFDDFRRDFFLAPIAWTVVCDGSAPALSESLRARIGSSGSVLLGDERHSLHWPRLFVPTVYVHVTAGAEVPLAPPSELPPGTLSVLVLTGAAVAPSPDQHAWDLCVEVSAPDTELRTQKSGRPQPQEGDAYRSTWIASDVDTLFRALDIRCRAEHVARIEEEIENPRLPEMALTVVICTYKRRDKLLRALQSVAKQSLPLSKYEVIVVNNDIADRTLATDLMTLRNEYFSSQPERLRQFDCPLLGLSHARNVGMAEARGKVIVYLDDDSLAEPDLLEQLDRAYAVHPGVDCIGGAITLVPIEPRPDVLLPGREGLWSQFVPRRPEFYVARDLTDYPYGANWSATRRALLSIGGFRTQYGRRANNFFGGEELVAASLLRRLGYKIGIEPEAKVWHDVSADRYTQEHVLRTLAAGSMVEYQATKDHYWSAEKRDASQLSKLSLYARQILATSVQSLLPNGPPREALSEPQGRLAGTAQVLRLRLHDTLQRVRLKHR